MEATHAWRKDGYRSAAHQLAQEAGISVGKAKAELETAHAMNKESSTASTGVATIMAPAKSQRVDP